MPMTTVMKFGGTSVADKHAFESVAQIIAERLEHSPVVVVSPMSGTTDALLLSAHLAEKGRINEAVGTLAEVLERHKSVAEGMLANEQARDMTAHIDNTAEDIAKLLRRISEELQNRKP